LDRSDFAESIILRSSASSPIESTVLLMESRKRSSSSRSSGVCDRRFSGVRDNSKIPTARVEALALTCSERFSRKILCNRIVKDLSKALCSKGRHRDPERQMEADGAVGRDSP
jgi:hypothetical protein